MFRNLLSAQGSSRIASVALVSAMFAIAAPAALHAQVGHNLAPRAAAMSDAEVRAIAESAEPAERLIEAAPGAQLGHPGPASEQVSPDPGPPRVREGNAGRVQRFRVGPENMIPGDDSNDSGQMQPIPLDYGDGQWNTLYHYNDYWIRPIPARFPGERSVGRMFFRFSGGGWSWCTGSLINRSIILTAGHCVHQGGNQADGWIVEGYFVPAYSNLQNSAGNTYGRCDIDWVATTDEWYNIGNILDGYDVAVAVCDNPTNGPSAGGLIGWATGWLGFCYENCRWPYVQVAQFGYPGNYYGGGEMTVSYHLNESVSGEILGNSTVDFLYGTGMRGGSSGGPHVVNPYQMDSDSAMPGQFPHRNIAFAVTSWGFIAEQWKIQGASPLSGVNNSNNFNLLFNSACRRSRNTLGNNSCQLSELLPE